MLEKINSAKNFVKRNQTKILVSALTITTTSAALMKIGLKQHDEFLKEHDLYEAFYQPED